MSKEKIRQVYETLADSYNEKIDHKPHNAYCDRPNTLALMGDVSGKTVLDAACGPGKYAEILLQRGADVTGFDSSPKMVRHAQKRNPNAGHFFEHDLSKPFTTLTDQSFDIVLCALAMHYLEDWQPAMREFHRVLKPDGQLVISIEHPFFEYNYFKSTQYFETEAVSCTWNGFGQAVEVYSYRRSLQECMMAFTQNGFYIDRLVEPRPVKAFEALDPRHYKELHAFPAFMCIRGVKRK